MSQAHKGSRLSLKNLLIPVDFNTAHFSFDVDASGIWNGDVILPASGSSYTMVNSPIGFENGGKFGGAVSINEPTTNLLSNPLSPAPQNFVTQYNKKYIYTHYGTGTATISGGIYQTASAATFDGLAGTYINTGQNIPFSAGSAYTKSAWVYVSSDAGSNNILSGDNSHAFFIPSQKLQAGHNNNYSYVVDPSTIPTNTWTHVAVTYNSNVSGGQMTLYKNGIQIAQASNVPIPSANTTTYIGSYQTGNNMSGNIAEVSLWSRALTPSEMSIMFVNGPTSVANQSGLLGYWKLNEGMGTAIYPTNAGAVLSTSNGVGWTPFLLKETATGSYSGDYISLKYPQFPTYSRSGTTYDLTGNAVSDNIPRYANGKVGSGILVEQAMTNLYPGQGSTIFNVYNNFPADIVASITTVAGETFMGKPIYRLSMRPTTAAGVTTLKTELFSHGVYSPSTVNFLAGTMYANSVYWRSAKTDLSVGGTASNTPPWYDEAIITNAGANTWNRSVAYKDGSAGSNVTDSLYWSIKSPSIVLNETITVDFTCPQLESGRTNATWFSSSRGADAPTIPAANILSATVGTIDFWLYRNNTQNTYQNPFAVIIHGSGNQNRFGIERNSWTNQYYLVINGPVEGSASTNTPSFTLLPNLWYYIAVTWSFGVFRVYVNGVLQGSAYTASSGNFPSSYNNSTIDIGFVNNWGGREINGIIDEFRISNVARSAAEISTAYALGGHLPYDDNVTAKFTFDQYLGYGNRSTVTTPVMSLVGTDTNYTNIISWDDANTGADFNLLRKSYGSASLAGYPTVMNEVTFEFWASSSLSAGPSNNVLIVNTLIGNDVDNASNRFWIGFPYIGSIMWDFGNDTTGRLQVPWQASWDNKMAHWAFTAGLGKGMCIYRNGELLASGSQFVPFTRGTKNLRVGQFTNYPATGFFTGRINEMRAWNYVRTQDEIKEFMNVELYGNEVGLESYYRFNRNASGRLDTVKDETENSNTLTLSNVKRSTMEQEYTLNNSTYTKAVKGQTLPSISGSTGLRIRSTLTSDDSYSFAPKIVKNMISPVIPATGNSGVPAQFSFITNGATSIYGINPKGIIAFQVEQKDVRPTPIANGIRPSGKITYPHPLYGLTSGTVNMWVYFESSQRFVSGNQVWIWDYDGITTTPWLGLLNMTGEYRLMPYDTPATAYQDSWHMYTLVRGSDGLLTMYIDGALIAVDSAGDMFNASKNITFGDSELGGFVANVMIDEVRMDPRVVSAEEVMSWYISQTPHYNPYDYRGYAY